MSRTHTVIGFLLITLLCSGALGCAHGGGEGGTMSDQLKRATTLYFDGIRWKRFSQSALLVPPAKRAAFVQSREEARSSFFVTDCEILGMHIDKEKEKAVVEVEFQWYLLPSTSIHTTRIQQLWSFKDGWLIEEQVELKKEAITKEAAKDLL